MKTAWHSLLLVLVLVGVASGFDQIHIEASLDDSTRTISGATTVTFAEPDSAMTNVHFRLWGAYRCEGHGLDPMSGDCAMRIDSAFVNGDYVVASIADLNPADAVINLPERAVRDTLRVVVYFTTIVPNGFDRLGHVAETYYLDGWFPMPAPWRDGQWAPVLFTPETELVGDFYDFEVIFRANDSLQQIAPGLVSADTVDGTVSAQYVLEPAHDFAMAIGRGFSLSEYTEGETRVAIYHKTEQPGIDSLASSVRFTLRYMAEHVGPYRYGELLIMAGVPFSGGVEFPGMYWQGPPEAGTMTRLGRIVAIHETIHQWFYGMIGSSQAEAPWMDESITEYFTALIADAESEGPTGLEGYGFSADASVIDRLQGHAMLDDYPITWAAAAYDRQNYYGTIYGKGSMVIHTFASLLGPEEDRFWRTYYERFVWRTPTEEDFISLANEFQPFSERQNAEEVLRFNGRLDYRIGDIMVSRPSDTALVRSEIRYALTNPLPFTIPMRLELSSGVAIDTTLLPIAGNHMLTINDSFPVVAARIDPEDWYAVDANYLNNSRRLEASGAALRLFSGLTFLVESLYTWLWGI